jgi:flagellar hook-associated protein 2
MSGFNISGLGSGIDWNNLISSVIDADTQALINTVGRREVTLSQQQAVFSNVKGAMTNFRTSIQAFKSAGNFRTKVSTSSDQNIITASASATATPQNVKVKVLSVATQAEARLSFEGTDSIVHTGDEVEATIKVRGVERKLTIPNGTTLAELADIINAANIGIRANVYESNDGTDTPARLNITDVAMGPWENPEDLPNIEFTDFANVLSNISEDPTYIEPSQTVVEIRGEQIVRNNLIISDVLPGVNLQVKAADPEKEITISITESTANAGNAVKKMIDSYNQVIGTLRQALAVDLSQDVQENPTAGDSTLRGMLTQLQSNITSVVQDLPEGNSIQSLADLGVTSIRSSSDPAQNGFLQFDEAKFNAAIGPKFDEIVQFFEGYRDSNDTKVPGYVDKMDDLMQSFLATQTGAIEAKLNGLRESLKTLNVEKLRRIEFIERKEERLTLRFARLESQLASLNSQQSQLDSAITSLNNTQQQISRRK